MERSQVSKDTTYAYTSSSPLLRFTRSIERLSLSQVPMEAIMDAVQEVVSIPLVEIADCDYVEHDMASRLMGRCHMDHFRYLREVPKLVFRRADQKFISFLSNNPITDNVKRYIDIAGFGGVIDFGYRNLDHGLLEALIERWRPETHTFHLPIGEVSLGNLCKAASNNSTNIGGPLYILQLWAWSRITTLAPTIIHQFDNRRPYGAMWREKLTYKDAVSHSLIACRSQLRSLREGEFKWRPYEEVIGFLPGICRSGIRSWQSECFLIYWDVVEFHTPQRVMRKFGMVQRIPDPIPLSFNEHMKLHTIIRTGKPYKNWPNMHSQFLSVWNQRWENAVQGVRCAAPTVEPSYNTLSFLHLKLRQHNKRCEGNLNRQ
ncbi:hypothetical protein E3N88_13702 [Mikania micrantha]|uniref:Aminotransferase-like plant mobile domain-containing protein n=1 Tax=Mikania micrantha TaxID=192012 RepID=A0A5N6NZP8_9ASTR|nr:hypothetical protein E3N88_13702 [Mikania micrantha]